MFLGAGRIARVLSYPHGAGSFSGARSWMAASGGLVCERGLLISCRNVVFLISATMLSRCDYDEWETFLVQKKVRA